MAESEALFRLDIGLAAPASHHSRPCVTSSNTLHLTHFVISNTGVFSDLPGDDAAGRQSELDALGWMSLPHHTGNSERNMASWHLEECRRAAGMEGA